MNDIDKKIESLQKEIRDIKKDIDILKNSGNLFTDTTTNVTTLRQITMCVSEITNVPYAKIHSHRQDRQVIIPRQIISCIARWNFHYSSTKIGKYFGKNHATILYSTNTMKGLIQTDKKIAELYRQCLKCVKELNK